MAETSIEWTATRLPNGTILPGYTFNGWIGCTKVSDGCKFCYAEEMMDKRYGRAKWGPQGTRVVTSDAYWRQPLTWNREAEKSGIRRKVFCSSLADVFEDRPELHEPRARLFDLIRHTPSLTWLLLTKRPENIMPAIESALILSNGGDPNDKDYFVQMDGYDPETELGDWLNEWTGDNPPSNVWLGTSTENQAAADERHPLLMSVPAVCHFWSAEPLLGGIETSELWAKYGAPNWVIVGGESGPNARPMSPEWARSLRDQCAAVNVPYFFKQWGEWAPQAQISNGDYPRAKEAHFPYESVETKAVIGVSRIGKKAAGRLLDGREHNDVPQVEAVTP